MNGDNNFDTVRFDEPGRQLRGEPERDEFSHLHFDRTTRTWWGHPNDIMQLQTAVPVRNDIAAMGCL